MLRYQFGTEKEGPRSVIPCQETDFDSWCRSLREDIIGEEQIIGTAFGPRKLVYCDYTASGRAVGKIEDFILRQVLPYYGNTHTLTTATARQTTNFRNEARNTVKHYFNCDPQDDAVIFVENGTTGAVNKFVRILERSASWSSLKWGDKNTSWEPEFYFRRDRWGSVECTLCNVRMKNENVYRSHCQTAMHTEKLAQKGKDAPASRDPKDDHLLFLLDPWAHHSLSLPFREMKMDDPNKHVTIAEFTDNPHFIDELVECASKHKGPKIAVLSAGSNVTGSIRDVQRITQLLHEVACIVCWDFAAVAGHRKIDLNPKHLGDLAKIDVAFFSPHKLLGGPGTSGILVAKKRLLQNKVPATPGGGSVFYVTSGSQTYIQTNEDREEAGTPNIIACIKTGLVYHLANQTPHALIEKRERDLQKQLLEAWKEHKNIEILGGGDEDGLGMISFMIRRQGLYLHYNYVVCLLNDLFGVQGRGGCACAGPLGQSLLGIDSELARRFEHILETSGVDVIRPGFVRVGVHFTMSDEDIQVLKDAVLFVAEHGWQFLPLYTFDPETGEWELRRDSINARRMWLTELDFRSASSFSNGGDVSLPLNPISELRVHNNAKKHAHDDVPRGSEILERALAEIDKIGKRIRDTKNPLPVIGPEVAPFLWFALPQDFSKNEKIFLDKAQRPDASLFSVRGFTEPTPVEPKPVVNVEKSQELIAGYPKKAIRPSIPKPLRGLVGKAIEDFQMIKEGDRLLVGLSGGKDSIALLHVLMALQKSAPINFEIAAATVNPQTPEYDPSPLIEYMKALGVKYHFLSKPLIEMAKKCLDPKKPSICSFCSRMKRGMLYSCCREEGYNVLVLGQHLDDMAESFIMSSFHNGSLRTMKANYVVQQEDLRVIRPLAYVREKVTAALAVDNGLPIIADNCPACFAEPKERHRVKLMLAREEFEHPNLFSSLMRAMSPLIHITTAERLEDFFAPTARTKRNPIRDRIKKMTVDASAASAASAAAQRDVSGEPSVPAHGPEVTSRKETRDHTQEAGVLVEQAVEDDDVLAEEALMPCGADGVCSRTNKPIGSGTGCEAVIASMMNDDSINRMDENPPKKCKTGDE